MPITGTHALLYTSEPEALRACLRDVFGWKHVDAHDGWLIFALPPRSSACTRASSPRTSCRSCATTSRRRWRSCAAKGIAFEGEPQNQGFGIVVTMVLPGDVKVLLYQPRHPTAI